MAQFLPAGIDTSLLPTSSGPSSEIDVNSTLQFRNQVSRNRDANQRFLNDAANEGPEPYGMPVNPNYIARIVQDGRMVAKGYLPETFTVSVNSHYDPPFGQGIASQGALGNAIKVIGHTTLISQSMTMQVWTGTDPIELQLEMEFLAESDPYTEVILPIKKLMRLAMPKKTAGVGRLTPPGPQINWGATLSGTVSDVLTGLSDGSSNGEQRMEQMGATLRNAQDAASGKISVFVGNFLTFDNVVITNVTLVAQSMFDENGLPLKAQVSIAFRTFLVPAVSDSVAEDDLIRMFNGPGPGD